MDSYDISAIAEELNSRAGQYAVGELQEFRKNVKGLKHRPGKNIFSKKTIEDHYAFHHGGRTELQFNIGREGEVDKTFRYGVAFSFEPSQTLPTIDPLKPKVRLFNDYLNLHAEELSNLRMWHYRGEQRSDNYMPSGIPSELVQKGVFVFLGHQVLHKSIDYDQVLTTLDRLLPLYRYVESGGTLGPVSTVEVSQFTFRPGCSSRLTQTTAKLSSETIDVSLRHVVLQKMLYERLVKEEGADNVGTENPSGSGKLIDVVVKRGDAYRFYEIKTAYSPRLCLRQAIGQLLEYAYWSTTTNVESLVVAGEQPLDDAGKKYLDTLRGKFSLPIEYLQVPEPI